MKLTKKQQVAKEATLDALRIAQENLDFEVAHSDADDALCYLLEELGFGDVVAEYDKVEKW